MVTRFLLHDAADMSIRGVSDKRKFGLWEAVKVHHAERMLKLLDVLRGGGGGRL